MYEILIPNVDNITIVDWPSEVDLQLPCVLNSYDAMSPSWTYNGNTVQNGQGFRWFKFKFVQLLQFLLNVLFRTPMNVHIII